VQVQAKLDEFRRLGAEVIVVSFAQPDRLTQYLAARPWPFQVLADPSRSAYRAFGLGSATWTQLLKPRVIAKYLGLILRGRMPHMAHEDVHQLGGDFVFDRGGRVVFEYRSRDPADRPSISELLDAVRQALA
jgi:peroxiredoxin